MDEEKILNEESSTEDLRGQLTAAQQEIQSLTQQLNCLVLLAKKAWIGDEAATIHLARVIGIDAEIKQSSFTSKRTDLSSPGLRKTVKIADSTEEIAFKKTPMTSNASSQENIHAQPELSTNSFPSKNAYLQPFLKQSHIDPIRGQNSNKIFNNMIRHHQNELRKSPMMSNRNTPSSVRPRATKHLYRPASAEHVVRHLGTPISRNRPFFVFAGREFFQQTTNYSPLYQRALVTSGGSRQSQNPEFYDQSEVLGSTAAEAASPRLQTNKTPQNGSTFRSGARSVISDTAAARTSSALSSASSSKMTQLTERERRDAMRLQRQLNLPRQGWINQQA